ncbi:uncharacterized protein LOC122555134 [Chiloscyllium plagiosum]|uniref:uncharacterized protein LOC122555134 n=1 Tax=Chiloscyllium plagiosum TaxID=36176 RepID=UPI001CB8095A|nr:uncharacterized protein LOC122555134 [Chiloscyllium plagiosum]
MFSAVPGLTAEVEAIWFELLSVQASELALLRAPLTFLRLGRSEDSQTEMILLRYETVLKSPLCLEQEHYPPPPTPSNSEQMDCSGIYRLTTLSRIKRSYTRYRLGYFFKPKSWTEPGNNSKNNLHSKCAILPRTISRRLEEHSKPGSIRRWRSQRFGCNPRRLAAVIREVPLIFMFSYESRGSVWQPTVAAEVKGAKEKNVKGSAP